MTLFSFRKQSPSISAASSIQKSELKCELGHFHIKFDFDDMKLLISDEAGGVLWESVPSTPFIQSSCNNDYIGTGEGGAFAIIERDKALTLHQTIDYINFTSDEPILIRGTLNCPGKSSTSNLQYEFSLHLASERQLQFKIRLEGGNEYDRIFLVYQSQKEEDFYGFGEQFSYSTVKGQKVPILVREQGIGRGAQPITMILNNSPQIFGKFAGGDSFTTYAPIPHYITTECRSVFLENTEYSSFDLREPDRVVIRVSTREIVGRILSAPSMIALITEYTTYCGRMRPLPSWVGHGAIAGMQGGETKVLHVLSQLQHHDVPLVAFWLQDWCGKRVQKVHGGELKRLWWNWESDKILYPNWGEMVIKLKDQGVRMLTYMNTFLTDVETKIGGFERNLFWEARSAGLLVLDPQRVGDQWDTLIVNSGPGFEAGLLDLTNPKTWDWTKTLVKEQLFKHGVMGYMADFGEYTPYSSNPGQGITGKFHSGIPAESYHNAYPQEWARLHDEAVHELGLENEALLFHRSAYTLSPRYMNSMWAGDQNVTWDEHDGIKSAVIGMLSGGFSGLAITHSDIGGYTTFANSIPGLNMSRSKELLLRWMELAAFTAIFRTHEGNQPEANVQFYDNAETYAHLAFCAKLFASLAPYRDYLMHHDVSKLGLPLMRHLVLYYPEDPVVRKLTYQQYLLGSYLLVAPVLSPSQTAVSVHLPQHLGRSWKHLWTGKIYKAEGKSVVVPAPLGRPGVFVAEPREDKGLLDGIIHFGEAVRSGRLKGRL